MPKRVLISGGAGFVGRNLCYALLKEIPAPEIVMVDDLSTGKYPEKWELHPAHCATTLGGDAAMSFRISVGRRSPLIHANFISVLCGELGIGAKLILPRTACFSTRSTIWPRSFGGRRMIEDQPLLVGIDLAIDSLFLFCGRRFLKRPGASVRFVERRLSISRQCDQAFSYLTEDMIDFAEGVLAPDMTYVGANSRVSISQGWPLRGINCASESCGPFRGTGRIRTRPIPFPLSPCASPRGKIPFACGAAACKAGIS